MPVDAAVKQPLAIPDNLRTVPEFKPAVQVVLLREIEIQREEPAAEVPKPGVVLALAEEISAIRKTSVEIP